MDINNLDLGGFTEDQILDMVQRVFHLTDEEKEKLRREEFNKSSASFRDRTPA